MDQLLNQRYDIFITGAPPRFLGTGRLEYAQALGHYQIAFTGPIDFCGWLTVPAVALPVAEVPVFDDEKIVFTITRGYAVAIMRLVSTVEGKSERSYTDLRFPEAALRLVEKEL